MLLASPGTPSFDRALELAKTGRTTDLIIGDGNCFFRAISKELFGEQRFHYELRQTIVGFIKHNSTLFAPLLLGEHNTIEAHCESMSQISCFATQVELQAVPTFLQVPLYLYTKPPQKLWAWYCYMPQALPSDALTFQSWYRNLPLPAPPKYHLELCHTGLVHFDRIVPVDPRQWGMYSQNLPTLEGEEDPNVYSVD